MIIMLLEIERADVGQRSHATAMKEALRAVAVRHANVTIGKHFKNVPETAPGGAYGYVKRDPKYLERKRRKKGTTDPFVFSGNTKKEQRAALSSRITATQWKSTLKLVSPHILRPQQWKELRAVTLEELKEHSAFGAEKYAETLKKLKARKSRKRIA